MVQRSCQNTVNGTCNQYLPRQVTTSTTCPEKIGLTEEHQIVRPASLFVCFPDIAEKSGLVVCRDSSRVGRNPSCDATRSDTAHTHQAPPLPEAVTATTLETSPLRDFPVTGAGSAFACNRPMVSGSSSGDEGVCHRVGDAERARHSDNYHFDDRLVILFVVGVLQTTHLGYGKDWTAMCEPSWWRAAISAYGAHYSCYSPHHDLCHA